MVVSVCQSVERYRFVVCPGPGVSHGMLGVRRLGRLGLRLGVAAPVASVEVGTANRAFGHSDKETIPVVLAAACWGRSWTSRHVLFRVDNCTVVYVLRSGSCRDQQVMRLILLLHFAAAELNFTLPSSTFRAQKKLWQTLFHEI